LSEKLIELYRASLNDKGLKSLDANFEIGNGQLFSDFHELSRVWTHPWVLKLSQMTETDDKDDKDDKYDEDMFENEASGEIR
jgi:hypothetical protein